MPQNTNASEINRKKIYLNGLEYVSLKYANKINVNWGIINVFHLWDKIKVVFIILKLLNARSKCKISNTQEALYS